MNTDDYIVLNNLNKTYNTQFYLKHIKWQIEFKYKERKLLLFLNKYNFIIYIHLL